MLEVRRRAQVFNAPLRFTSSQGNVPCFSMSRCAASTALRSTACRNPNTGERCFERFAKDLYDVGIGGVRRVRPALPRHPVSFGDCDCGRHRPTLAVNAVNEERYDVVLASRSAIDNRFLFWGIVNRPILK